MLEPAVQELYRLLETRKSQSELKSLFNGRAVCLYGAGNVGKDIFKALIQRGIPVRFFFDQRASPGDAWRGIPILQPDTEFLSEQERKQVVVVLSIFNRDVEIPPIVEKLAQLGFQTIVTLLEFYDYFSEELGNRFWLTPKSFYAGLELVISAGYQVWADQASREIYLSILRFRFTNDYAVLPSPDRANQYFPLDLLPWKTPIRFIDCGAYDGDTLAQLLATGVPLQAVAAFEPDQANFVKLAQYVSAHGSGMPNPIVLYPCGVSSRTEQLRFLSGQDSGSHAALTGEGVIQCVSLDEALPKFSPTLIKMDIEGSEYDALLGARRIIAEHNPGLAICVYHRAEHLWQIPLLVQQLSGQGRFYLRAHNFSGFELVMYFIPD